MITRQLIRSILVATTVWTPFSAVLNAQSTIWTLLPYDSSNVPTSQPAGMWFTDSLNGFGFDLGNRLRSGFAERFTTDGGRTWARDTTRGPIPRQTFDRFSVGWNGTISIDGGLTWKDRFIDSSLIDDYYEFQWYVPIDGAAGSSVDGACIVQVLSDPDDNSSTRYSRLVFTRDSGTSWHVADTLADRNSVISNGIPELNTVGSFADLGDSTQWHFLVGYPSPDSLVAVVCDLATGRHALAVLNLRDTVSEVRDFAFWDTVSSSLTFCSEPMELIDGIRLVAFNTLRGWASSLLVSDDFGLTWEARELPAWLQTLHLSFLTPEHWVGSNGESTDGGRSWIRKENPFRPTGTISPHRYFACVNSQRRLTTVPYGTPDIGNLAESNDRGETWTRDSSYFISEIVSAGDVLLGFNRVYGTRQVLRSLDNGESWNDLGNVPGELPDGLSTILGLADAPTPSNANRFLGVGLFAPKKDDPYVASFESTNGGQSWHQTGVLDNAPTRTRPTLPELTSLRQPNGSFHLFTRIGTVMYHSSNEGKSWSTMPGAGQYDVLPVSSSIMLGSSNRHDWFESLVRTTNGGMTWDTVTFDSPVEQIRRYFVIHTSTWSGYYVLAVTPDHQRRLFVSRDSGSTWNSHLLDNRTLPSPNNVELEYWWWMDSNSAIFTHLDYTYDTLHIVFTNDQGRTVVPVADIKWKSTIFQPYYLGHDDRRMYFRHGLDEIGRLSLDDKFLATTIEQKQQSREAPDAIITVHGRQLEFVPGEEFRYPAAVHVYSMNGRLLCENTIGVDDVLRHRRIDLEQAASRLVLVVVQDRDGNTMSEVYLLPPGH